MTTPKAPPLTREEVQRWTPEHGHGAALRDAVLALLDERDAAVADLTASRRTAAELALVLEAETEHRNFAVEGTRRAEADRDRLARENAELRDKTTWEGKEALEAALKAVEREMEAAYVERDTARAEVERLEALFQQTHGVHHGWVAEEQRLRVEVERLRADAVCLTEAMGDAVEMLRRPKNQHSNSEAAATLLERSLSDRDSAKWLAEHDALDGGET